MAKRPFIDGQDKLPPADSERNAVARLLAPAYAWGEHVAQQALDSGLRGGDLDLHVWAAWEKRFAARCKDTWRGLLDAKGRKLLQRHGWTVARLLPAQKEIFDEAFWKRIKARRKRRR